MLGLDNPTSNVIIYLIVAGNVIPVDSTLHQWIQPCR